MVQKNKGKSRKPAAFWRNLLRILVIAALAGMSAGGYFALAKGIPSVEEIKQSKGVPGTRVYADDDTLIGELKAEKGIFVPLNKMPASLVNAAIAVEDSRFWKHKGVDYIAILRAALKDVLHVGLREGGSTITQQLAKITFLTPEKTLQRKVKEMILAIKIEKNLSKKEILELYLNRVYLGHGAYGMEMAARVYFGKSVKEVNLPEAALLAGLTKAPSLYSPYNNLARAKERQETVLLRMEEEGYIKKEERERAARYAIVLSNLRRGMESNNYFIEYVRKYLEEKYGEDTVYKGELSVYTTLDKKAQVAASQALQEGLRELDKRRGWRGPIDHREIDVDKEMKEKDTNYSFAIGLGDIASGAVLKAGEREAIIKSRGVTGRLSLENARWASLLLDSKTGKTSQLNNFSIDKILKPGDVIKVGVKSAKRNAVEFTLEQEPDAEGAVIAIDHATGFIRALIGGFDYSKSEYNRAVYAMRQPGSAFKPIIYAAAMDNGFTPASVIIDEPVTYHGGPKGDWSPENYDHKYNGPTRLRDALAYSRNVVTVKLLDEVGLDKIIEFARNVGFEEEIPRNLSIALGSMSITPMNLAAAYSVFANGGAKMKPIAVKYITDSKGMVIESNEPEGEQIVSSETAFLITSMMEDVVNYGTGWRIKALGKPVAGKTGTTNDYKDAWFVGYTGNLTTCVWVGFDDMRPLGSRETGARAASPIWLNFMRAADTGETVDFSVPDGIVSYTIDPLNGLLAKDGKTGLREYFKKGTQPKEYSQSPSKWEGREQPAGDFD